VAVAAPLAAGDVHRIPLIISMAVTIVGLLLFSAGMIASRRTPRLRPSVLFWVGVILIPALQSIPIPHGLRAALDSKGTALLDYSRDLASAWPLSLDPPGTRADIGKAALALAVFMVGFHLASGQRRRHLFTKAVAAAGITAVAVEIGHRLFGIQKLYGILVSTHRTLVIGPFVNANHTAELLELAAFACLASSFQRPNLLNRVGWLIGTIVCVSGVTATLSRGGLLGLVMGTALYVSLRAIARDGAAGDRRRTLLWASILLGFIVLGASALGAGQLIDRFQSTDVTGNVRFRVWRDSLRVLAAHPLGIGRGAFDRVFPIYRTVKAPFPLRFAFVENEPLQWLIDCGWPMFIALAAGFGLIVVQIFRRGRRDRIEAALLAGLFAVLVHNLVDFGLETPGVLLPFTGILATVLGRIATGDQPSSRWRPWLVVILAGAACAVGLAAIASPAYDDFDALLRHSRTVAEQEAVLSRARRTHPLDYFYALAAANFAPLHAAKGTSPRFHILNQAMQLCPGCEDVHLATARNLWAMGSRKQALLEWRTAVELQPRIFNPALGELFRLGARPAELASLATFDPAKAIEVADFLGSQGRLEAATTVLDQAEAIGAPREPVLLTRARLQMQGRRFAEAQQTLQALEARGYRSAALATLQAELVEDRGDENAGDEALKLLDDAAMRYPGDVPVQKMRVDVVLRYQRWSAAARAVAGYKQALFTRDGSATDAHLAAARIAVQLSHWTDAIDEYRLALAGLPTDVALWLEFGRACEAGGRLTAAREAYSEAGRLSPNNPETTAAINRLNEQRQTTVRKSLFDTGR
jgi:tetratricopeptide (TPR) repeat protein